jgi:hypothetical protein
MRIQVIWNDFGIFIFLKRFMKGKTVTFNGYNYLQKIDVEQVLFVLWLKSVLPWKDTIMNFLLVNLSSCKEGNLYELI